MTVRPLLVFALSIVVAAAFTPRHAGAQTGPVAVPTTLQAPPTPALGPAPTPSSTSLEPAVAPTSLPPRLGPFGVTAKRVDYYSARFVVGANDGVEVKLGDGTRITGDTFAMDLRLNRFIVAGNVKLYAGGQEIDGAAFSEYLDFDRAYFLPVIGEPDRWTYAAGDYSHPLRGRQMPGDTFFLPDVANVHVFLYATKAFIDPHQSVRFSPAAINFGLTYVKFPSYFLNFSPNPNFSQNALPGSEIDGPYDFAGGSHALATAHLRYDSVNKVFFGYEQHQVGDRHYLVAAISPLTRPLKQYNFEAFDRLSPKFQVQGAFQETAFQLGFVQPLSATGYANLQLTAGLSHSFLLLNGNQFWQSFLAQPAPGIDGQLYYGDPTHNWVPDHPVDLTLSWTGYRNRIGSLPLFLQLRSSWGIAHNAPPNVLGEQPAIFILNGTLYPTIWNKAVGLDLSTDAIRLIRDQAGLRRDLILTASFDKQRQWFTLPHHIDTTFASVALSKVLVTDKLAAVVAYTNQNTSDFWGNQQSIVYPEGHPAVSPFTGEIFPDWVAFRGFSTTRSLTQQLIFTPSTSFTFTARMRENHDFPSAVPGLPQVIGFAQAWNNFGVPPYQATLDTRVRLNSFLVLDVSRSYYFNFGGYQRWDPSFNVQVLK